MQADSLRARAGEAATAAASAARDAADGAFDRLANVPLFTIGRTAVTPLTLLTALAIVLATLVLARVTQRATTRAFRLRGVADEGTSHVAARLAGYAVTLVGLGIAVQTVGVELGTLFTAGAVFAVAVGFAVQNVGQNFVSGVILLTERAIKPGDVLEVEGRTVRVTRMGLRATVARTRDEEDLIIPNATLVQNTITNYTLRDTVYRLRATVGVSYDADVRRVVEVLTRAAEAFPARIADHAPRVLLLEFGDSALLFEVLVWVQDPWRARALKSELNQAIWWALKEAEIAIPFPQRDVHLVSVRP
jgi:small-conductance mechanosensitive channel